MVGSTRTHGADATQRRRGGPAALSKLVSRIARTSFDRRGFTEAQILTRWPDIVGADLAASSCPIRLGYEGRAGLGGVLHVRAESAAALELQHMAPIVIERVNRHFGYAAVRRLFIAHGPMPRSARSAPDLGRAVTREEARLVDETVAEVADEGLKSALARLGRAVIGAGGPRF